MAQSKRAVKKRTSLGRRAVVSAKHAQTTGRALQYTKGVMTAIVTQNNDPDGQCRVKVRYPWHDNPRAEYWARLAVPMAGKDRGAVFIPEAGDEVLVAFAGDDQRFPFVIGSLWNAQNPPPETNSDGRNNKRLIKSRKGHRLLFDDGTPGAVELALQDGKKVVLDDSGVRLEDNKGNLVKVDSSRGTIEIKAIGALTIKAASITIEAAGKLDVKAGATLTLRGALVNIN